MTRIGPVFEARSRPHPLGKVIRTPSMVLTGYLGKSDVFDRALTAFSVAYADQNERDHAALSRAVRKGEVPAEMEEGQ